jgi:endonuclease/exonuclease/phosphatase family metal-dependent hydrolase
MSSPPEAKIDQILSGEFASPSFELWPRSDFRIVDWNIDRGLRLGLIIRFLRSFRADIVLLQEVDFNCSRTHHLDIAQEIARTLQLNYVFGREFQELTQGSADSPAYQGQATFSRWPLTDAHVIRFARQSDFWQPHWFLPRHVPFQERLGGRMALCVGVKLPQRTLITYNLHLESKKSDSLRMSQLNQVLQDSARLPARYPVLIAGDMNLNAAEGYAAAALARAGFRDAVGEPREPTRPAHLLGPARSVDGIFVNRRLRSRGGQVHGSTSGSDHYPVSVKLYLV